jgi:8-oxo-dGTP pyrophosphatase MutT (NUDIX family)
MQFAPTIARLEARLRSALPGETAQRRMAPRPPRQWPSGFTPAQIRHAAGLLLLYPIHDRVHIVLTVRADRLRHGGQVSLPGGVVEAGETYEEAALREAHEEIDLSPEDVRVLGALTPLDIPVSGFRLHPIVAVHASRPALRPADGEVAAVIELDVDDLMAPDQPRVRERLMGGAPVAVPGFHVHTREIWGATAMVLAEFLTLLGWETPPLA